MAAAGGASVPPPHPDKTRKHAGNASMASPVDNNVHRIEIASVLCPRKMESLGARTTMTSWQGISACAAQHPRCWADIIGAFPFSCKLGFHDIDSVSVCSLTGSMVWRGTSPGRRSAPPADPARSKRSTVCKDANSRPRRRLLLQRLDTHETKGKGDRGPACSPGNTPLEFASCSSGHRRHPTLDICSVDAKLCLKRGQNPFHPKSRLRDSASIEGGRCRGKANWLVGLWRGFCERGTWAGGAWRDVGLGGRCCWASGGRADGGGRSS